ncbi:MAG: B12-binding domain-containing radical SAM protein [Phycisphaerae bacterium]|nr:B12-binding domain-containing radical SAM protein [Phycisphaerae bacterium]
MKVLLIHPPTRHMIRTNVPKSVDEVTGLYPPLGLLYVAAGAQAWTQAEVTVLDAPAHHMDQAAIGRHVSRLEPDVVGIQTMTFTLVDAIQTVETVKSAHPNAHVTLGGPHVNLYPIETISIPGVDSLVLGEGERPFADLVNTLADGGAAGDVSGVVVQDGGIPNVTSARPLEKDLDDLPHPARDLLDSSIYWSVLATYKPITTMMTSRGCPMKCVFCDRPHLGKTFRFRSAGSVVDEMETCVKKGIRELFLYDDTFSLRRQRIFEICDEITRRNLDVHWDVRARADTLDDEVVAAMKRAGITRMHIGVESGSPRILDIIRKGIDLEQAYEAFELCGKHGITSLGYFMFGNPTETRDDIEMTMEFLRNCKANHAHIAITTPFPGTELYRMGLEQGLYPNDYWQEFAAHPDASFQPPAWTENFTQQELEDLRQEAYRSFYSRPSRLLRQLFAVRSFGELWMKGRAGLKVLFSK